MMINSAGSQAGDRAAERLVAMSRRGTRQSSVRVTDRALARFLDLTGAAEGELIRDLVANSLERGRAAAERLGVANFTIVADGLCYVFERGNLLVSVDEDDRNRRRWRR